MQRSYVDDEFFNVIYFSIVIALGVSIDDFCNLLGVDTKYSHLFYIIIATNNCHHMRLWREAHCALKGCATHSTEHFSTRCVKYVEETKTTTPTPILTCIGFMILIVFHNPKPKQ